MGKEPKFGTFPVQRFSGDGSTTSFTLTEVPATNTSLLVTISGVKQQTSAYSVTDTALDFGAGNAPPSGTNNIEVVYMGQRSLVAGVADGTISSAKIADGAILNADVNASAAIAGSKLDITSLNLADGVLQRPLIKDYSETKQTMAAHAVDLTLGNVQTYTLSGSQTLTFTNPIATGNSSSFTLIVTNGGSATLTWPTSVDWAGGTAPTLTSAGIDILTFTTIDGGTIWYGFLAGADMK